MRVSRMFYRALVPVDLSTAARDATEKAAYLAAQNSAELVLCAVVNRTQAIAFGSLTFHMDPAGAVEAAFRAARQALRHAAQIAWNYKVPVIWADLIEGSPAGAVAKEASFRGADLVIVGTSVHRNSSNVMNGNVIKELVRCTDVPLLLVKSRAGE